MRGRRPSRSPCCRWRRRSWPSACARLAAAPPPAPATSPTTASRSSTSPASTWPTPSGSRPSWRRSPASSSAASSRAGAPTSSWPARTSACAPSCRPLSPAAPGAGPRAAQPTSTVVRSRLGRSPAAGDDRGGTDGFKARWGVGRGRWSRSTAASRGPSSHVASPRRFATVRLGPQRHPCSRRPPVGRRRRVSVDGIPFSFNADPFQSESCRSPTGPSRATPGSRRGRTPASTTRRACACAAHGRMYDFPRGQASYGLDNLNSYRLTRDKFYLDRALAQAERLLSYHDVGGDAWYYPNYPSRSRHGRPGELIKAPYYSALPQGRILLFFSRLAEVTGSRSGVRPRTGPSPPSCGRDHAAARSSSTSTRTATTGCRSGRGRTLSRTARSTATTPRSSGSSSTTW